MSTIASPQLSVAPVVVEHVADAPTVAADPFDGMTSAQLNAAIGINDEAYQRELLRDELRVRKLIDGMARHAAKLTPALSAIFTVINDPAKATREQANAAFNAYFETVRQVGLMCSDCAVMSAKAREAAALHR